jgi:hypothetical protein
MKMKKTLAILAVALLASGAFGQMVDRMARTFNLVTTNSDSASQVIYGQIEAVWVDVAATKTNVVLITDDYGTIYSETVAADALKPIRVPLYGSTGTALTESYSIWNNITNSVGTNPIYGPRPVAGKVTIRAAGAADTTGTNAVSVILFWKKN